MKLAAPDAPDVGLSGDLPSADIDASGSLPSGEVVVSAPSVSGVVEGLKAGVGDVATDVEAKVDAMEVQVPDLPSFELKKPKKGLLGLSFRRSSKAKIEVNQDFLLLSE